MKFLFFDTETNGLPKQYNASYEDVDNWPRVIQFAWMLTDEAGNIIKQCKELVYPNGWTVPTDPFWIENGFSQKENEEKGIAIEILLDGFMGAKMGADVLVAHNLNFDHRIVWAEFIRAGRRPRSGMHKVCTMMTSTKHCGIIGKNNRVKWPKLEELHEFLFKKGFDGAHDAMADVIACRDCFFELLKLGVIALPVPADSVNPI